MNIDSIVVISVKEAIDRRKRIVDWWSNPKIKLQFNIVEKNKENPAKGCFTSHADIIKNAKKSGLNRILILEDDAQPTTSIDNLIKKVNKAMRWLDNNDPKWTYLMLGYFPIRSEKTNNKDIVNIKCAYLSHAYIANLKNINPPNWNNNKKLQIDDLLFCDGKYSNLTFTKMKNKKSRVYGLRPMIVKQYGIDSFISYSHSAIQEHFLHVVGQDNIAELSCHVNIIYFLILVFLILILTLLGIPIILLNDKYPTLSNIYLAVYVILIISFIILSVV